MWIEAPNHEAKHHACLTATVPDRHGRAREMDTATIAHSRGQMAYAGIKTGEIGTPQLLID